MKYLILFKLLFAISFCVQADAFKFIKHSCNSEKYSEACYKMANIYRRKSDNKNAKIYYKKGCELGHKDSCKKRIIPKLVIKSLYIKRNRSIASLEINIVKASKGIKDPEKRMEAISRYHCERGSKEACMSLKCGFKDLKNPECKDHFKIGFSKMASVIENPMKFLEKYKKYFTENEFEDYKTSILRLSKVLKECIKGQECTIDGEKIDASKELMIIGSKVNNLATIVNDKKCKMNNKKACYARDLALLSQENLALLKSLDI